MDDQSARLRGVRVQQLNAEVREAPGHVTDGLAIGHDAGKLVLALTRGGACFYVRLGDPGMDEAAGMIADAIIAANRETAPSLRTMQ